MIVFFYGNHRGLNSVILGIETSCDETSAAVLCGGAVLSNVVSSQLEHSQYGGVVPELASRMHLRNIVPVVRRALEEAELGFEDLDAVGVTCGPGLIGALMVGVSYARALGLAVDIPVVPVHHMQAHVHALWIEYGDRLKFPFLCLTVSGGHTQLVRVEGPLKMRVVGQTLDDAAGEAFDKIGKLLGLPYPAGPRIDALAREGTVRYAFPKAKVPGWDFSFSGLKTAVLYFLRQQREREHDFIQKNINDICASVQANIVEVLVEKTIEAAEAMSIRQVAIAGGVAGNSLLRARIRREAERREWEVYIPSMAYCTDNAAMVAMQAALRLGCGADSPYTAVADPALPWIDEIDCQYTTYER